MTEKKLPSPLDDEDCYPMILTADYGPPGKPWLRAPALREARFPRKKSLAWLRELAGGWSQLRGSNLFRTRSTPLYTLDDETLQQAITDGAERTLLSLTWWSVPGCSSYWTVEAIDFGRASRLYLERRRDEGLCLLAYSDDASSRRSDAGFLLDFFETNGDAYDTFIMGGPPDEASGSRFVSDELLVELLVSGGEACPWYEPIPEDLEALARRIIGGKGEAGWEELDDDESAGETDGGA